MICNEEINYLAENLEQMRVALKHYIEEEGRLKRENNMIVSKLSHDIKTPLTSMMLFIELIKNEKYANENEKRRYIDKIYKSAERLNYLADGLHRHVSGDEVIGSEDVSIMHLDEVRSALIDAAENLRLFGFDTKVIFSEGDFSEITCDEITMNMLDFSRIIDNIISNITRHGDKSETVTICVEANGDSIIISFENEPIEPMNCSEQMIGIGLGNVYQLTERHGGSVIIENEKMFRISLHLK